MDWKFNAEDLGQIVIGAFALGVPISFSEEAWQLSESLPLLNLSVLVVLTLAFMGLYAYQSMFGQNIRKRVPVFLVRVLGAYLITYLVVCLILFSLNQFPLIDNWVVAVKRALIIAMPASMGAIIVDSFDKE
ncbi:DUF2391 family protein [Photobacterium sp. SP02]|uniref:DUF2391 family protein n=1 Tax=Photobacterium halotolerans TaxID=265726 RepID=A0A7X4WAY1_9GAMM|nr:DUF2391 family protein [Photobacterium halotolerans]NAW64030.1 DUF2391 family protein [Photobacterium halotolerans]NAW88506.1 DUF2391 family protein [Photobacterium halotolerans]NAX49416.1 DUF2391 family protein [Photobacterium halotolerans]